MKISKFFSFFNLKMSVAKFKSLDPLSVKTTIRDLSGDCLQASNNPVINFKDMKHKNAVVVDQDNIKSDHVEQIKP